MSKYKIAFICNSNSKRSQIAEAITKYKYGSYFEVYSAGLNNKDKISELAVKVVKEKINIDILDTQSITNIIELPSDLDIIIEMGCELNCPIINSTKKDVIRINFNIPATKSYLEVSSIFDDIERKIDNVYDIIFNSKGNLKW